MLSSSLLTGTDVLEQQLIARSYLCTLEPAMLVESGTAPHLTATPGDTMAPVGLPGKSSIHANGAHRGTSAAPSHQHGCGGNRIRPLGDPKHPRLMPSQVRFRSGLPAAFNH